MSAIARTIESFNVNPRSLVISGAVLFGIIGLFIIPEMVGFHRTSSARPVRRMPVPLPDQAGEQSPSNSQLAPVVEQAEPAPLDKVLSIIETRPAAVPAPVAGSVASNGVASNGAASEEAASGQTAPADAAVAPVSDIRNELRKDPITWDLLAGGPMNAALNKARADVSNIMGVLRVDQNITPTTIYSMYNFQNGLDRVVGAAAARSGFPTAEDALIYLELLDSDVTRRLVGDRVGSELMERWTHISLGPALTGSRSARLKERYKTPFRPNMTLNWVDVTQSRDGHQSSLLLRAYAFTTTVTKVSVYRNGRFMGDIGLQPPDSEGRLLIQYHNPYIGKGTWSFRLFGQYGEVYEKQYRFLPNVQQFQWRDDWHFKIPGNDYHFWEPNKQLDRYFAGRSKTTIPGIKSLGQGGESAASTHGFEPLNFESGFQNESWEKF